MAGTDLLAAINGHVPFFPLWLVEYELTGILNYELLPSFSLQSCFSYETVMTVSSELLLKLQ